MFTNFISFNCPSISVFPNNLPKFFIIPISSSFIFVTVVSRLLFQASPADLLSISSTAFLNILQTFPSTFSDIYIKVLGIGSYVNLIFVINMFSAFFISCNSFTLYAYFFEKVIPIIVLVINIRFKINNFIQNILFSYLIFLQIIFLFSSKNKNLSNVFVLYNLPSIGFLITSSILSPCAVNIPFMPEQTA